MTRYAALLRAVNVGGTGKLSMSELKAMCADAGFQHVETYIASGNVVFDAGHSEARVKAELETRLRARAGKPVAVAVRTADELRRILEANPFRDEPANQTVAIFLDEPPPADCLSRATGKLDEEMHAGTREIYVHYPQGIGRSKLKIPAAANGTARNMNTIAKLADIAGRR